MDNFNFELLRVFLVVSKLKSFSRASEYLYVDQSTISKKIRQLENKFNVTLFVRTARGVELTIAGQEFQKRAQKLIADYEQLLDQSPLKWADLRIGAFDNIAAYCYPQFFTDHFAEFKFLKIENEGIKLVEAFNNGELDLLVVNGALASQIRGQYVSKNLANEGLAVMGRCHELTAKPYSITDLYGKKLLLAPDYCPVSRQLSQYRSHFRSFKVVDYTATMIQLIRRSDFLTVLPMGMVDYLTSNDKQLMGAPLTGLPNRIITAFAREQLVLDKLVAALRG
ncbi:LysR family transcriptional regulator [Limosilactobacillus sp.]|uniref:LysR family transcriptional regulator n=1 Tax=Limosilactobacillus sp. TaxID=2773925 RepID=UPI003EFFF05A